MNAHTIRCISFLTSWPFLATITVLLCCLPQQSLGVEWTKTLAEAKKTALKKDAPIAIFWSDGAGTDTPVTPNGRFGNLEKKFIWMRLDKTKDAATYKALGIEAYFDKGGETHSTKTMHRTSGYVFMNAKGDIYARLPGNKLKWTDDWMDSMLMAVCRRHYGPEKFYVDESVGDSGASDPSAFGRPKKMSGKVTTRKTPVKLHTWKTCDTCKAFLKKAMPYIVSKYPHNWYGGMLGSWPGNAAITMYGKDDALVKAQFPGSAKKYFDQAPTTFSGYWNWFRAGNAMALSEYALRYGLTPEIEKLLVDTQQEASEYIDECMAWFHHPRRGGKNYSLKQGLIASMFHGSFVEMEFMGLEAEPGLSLSRASLGRYGYGSSDQAGKTGLLVGALYASGWADDPFTTFQRYPMLNGPPKDKGALSYPRANFPGYAHGYAPWAWMGCAVGLHRMGPAEYAEWADLWIHPLITLQLAEGSIPKLPNDTFPQGPHAVGDDPMPYINVTKEKSKGKGEWESTCVIASMILMTEPGAFYGVPIKPKGSIPNKEAFSKAEKALRSRDYATAYANFAIVLPPGKNMELVPQARIHMRELQIELCPDRDERRKRARKIAAFSAEKRAKGEISIYAKAARGSSRSAAQRKKTPPRKARNLASSQLAVLDGALLRTLVRLSDGKKFKPIKLTISKTKAKVWLAKAEGEGLLTFQLIDGDKEASFSFKDLPLRDHATLAELSAALKNDSTDAQAMAAVYMEALNRMRTAETYYAKSNDASRQKLEALFD